MVRCRATSYGQGPLRPLDNLDVPRIRMHAEINGRWTMTLQAREEDIRAIRLVTGGEQIPGGAS